jgi:hypothetical protein
MARASEGTPMTTADNVAPMRPTFQAVCTSEINVIFTTLEGTLAAIRVAAALSRTARTPVRLIDARLVPYPLRSAGYALAAAPEVSTEERERERVIAAAGVPVDVQVYVCGRPADAMRAALRPHSLVILGGRGSWWPTPLERLRRTLESQGHIVMFVNDTED